MPLLSTQDYIYQAFRRCGQMRPGYENSPELLADALNEWNIFFDQLNIDPACQFTNPSYQYAITGPGSQTNGNGYLIGPTAQSLGNANDFNGPRPTSVIAANLVFTTLGSIPVYIRLWPLTQQEWASKSIQAIPATQVATEFWYDPQFPNGVFNVFPPLSGNAIQIYQQGSLVPPATLEDPYSAPPGYQEMVVSGLAKRLYFLVTKQAAIRLKPYGLISSDADRSLEIIKGMNRAIPELAADAPRGSSGRVGYDRNLTYTGEPY